MSKPVFFQHPLSNIPRDELRPSLVEIAKHSSQQFQEGLGAVLEILRACEPLQTITTLAVYGLFGSMDEEGKHRPLLKNTQFSQAHVELVQALALTLQSFGASIDPPNPTSIQRLFDVLPGLSESFTFQRMAVMEQERSAQQKAVTLMQELLRMHTQSVRNWGYFDRVVSIVDKLYEPLDEAFSSHVGMAATEIVATFLHLVRHSEREVRSRLDSLRQVWRKGNVAGAIRKYYELNPHFLESPARFLDLVRQRKLTLDQTRALIFAHSDFRLSEVFTFSPATIAAKLEVEEDRISSVFEKLSLSFGDLASHRLEHLFLDNPIWRKPVIKLGGGQYFCAMPQLFFSFVRPILDELVADQPAVRRACEDRRAKFLEEELALLFTKAFSEAEIVANYKWRDGNTEYENDLIVRIDSHLLLVEAKSGTVSWPALRGAPERARKHIEDLFISPSIQSQRLAERIEAAIRDPELRQSYLPDLGIQLDQVHTVLRLSVTLEDFATTQANLHALQGTGWLPDQHKLAPCILLADLEIIFDILESAGQKLHYLRRRTELAAGLTTIGDELDHLGLYLGTGFNLGEAEFSDAALHLIGMSKAIDEFCMARAEGVSARKPQCRLSKWWSQICDAVERRGFHQWSDVSSILLSLSFEEQEQAESAFKKLKQSVRERKDKSAQVQDTLFMVPPAPKADAIALYAFHDEDSEDRHERMRSIASQAFGHAHLRRCLVVGVNVHKDVYPYATLMVFFSEDYPAQPRSDDLTIY